MKNLLENLNKIVELLSILIQLINDERTKVATPEWLPVLDVANLKGLTPDAVRKQLQNGDYEEGLHFRYIGSRIYVHQGALEQIYRRRSSNG